MRPEAETMRDIERQRLRSLVTRDMAAADVLHADDYQLITPRGIALSKEEYLGDIASGQLRYQVFEAVSDIVVAAATSWPFCGPGADHVPQTMETFLSLTSLGIPIAMSCARDDWQAVWSQATAVD